MKILSSKTDEPETLENAKPPKLGGFVVIIHFSIWTACSSKIQRKKKLYLPQ